MLAASIETEIIELFKAQPFPQIANSTGVAPVYLKQVPGGAPDVRWIVPAANAWQTVPVEDVARPTLPRRHRFQISSRRSLAGGFRD